MDDIQELVTARAIAIVGCMVSPWNVRVVAVSAADFVKSGDFDRLRWHSLRQWLIRQGFQEQTTSVPTDKLCEHYFYVKG